MDTKWRLLVAVFLLIAACALGMLVSLFQDGWVAIGSLYAMLILIPWGIIKGIVAIWDHHRENKSE